MLALKEMSISGCYRLIIKTHQDFRGNFVKIFNSETFLENGLETFFKEDFFTVSKKNVVRGIHFQVPPAAHTKLVTCAHGEVQDVLVDLRRGSPTFGSVESIFLSSDCGETIYIPKGVGHGFCVLSEIAIMLYKTTTPYDPLCDSGILWNSCGVSWSITDPIVSDRDLSFDSFEKFSTPFLFGHE